MKVLTCISPGLFEYQDKPEPDLRAGYSLLRIHKIGICGTDLHAYKGRQPYFEYPRILGHEVAAEYVSGDAPDIRPGDLCTFLPYISCGSCIVCRAGKTNCCSRLRVSGVHLDGAMAEYYSLPSSLILPGIGLNEDELALIEPMSIAAHAIKSSRNATRENFIYVRDLIKNKYITVDPLITHRIPFGEVAIRFETLYDPGNRVIKALVEL